MSDKNNIVDDTVDDWEKAEINLDAMNLDTKKVASKPAMMILRPPARFNTDGDLSESTSAKIEPPKPVYVESLVNDDVDSALISAISNPRERMNLFAIENTILEFVKSSPDKTLELPAVFNSFRRLLTYRVAQRFGLGHSTFDPNAEKNGSSDRGITLFRTANTMVPKTLLIDLNIPVDTEQNQDGYFQQDVSYGLQSNSSKQDLVGLNNGPTADSSTVSAAPKKVQVMKRVTKGEQNNNKGSMNKQQQSAEEREKAYLEARARIFGEEATTTGDAVIPADMVTPTATVIVQDNKNIPKSSSTGSLSTANRVNEKVKQMVSSNNSSTLVVNKAETLNESSGKSGKSNSSTTNSNSKKPLGRVSPPLEVISNSQKNNSGSGKLSNNKKVVDVRAWKENKSQVRDVDAERSDPDFVRRSSPNTSGNSTSTNRNNINPYSGYQNNQGSNTSGYSSQPQPDSIGTIYYPQPNIPLNQQQSSYGQPNVNGYYNNNPSGGIMQNGSFQTGSQQGAVPVLLAPTLQPASFYSNQQINQAQNSPNWNQNNIGGAQMSLMQPNSAPINPYYPVAHSNLHMIGSNSDMGMRVMDPYANQPPNLHTPTDMSPGMYPYNNSAGNNNYYDYNNSGSTSSPNRTKKTSESGGESKVVTPIMAFQEEVKVSTNKQDTAWCCESYPTIKERSDLI
eukprot:gene6996-9560_t